MMEQQTPQVTNAVITTLTLSGVSNMIMPISPQLTCAALALIPTEPI